MQCGKCQHELKPGAKFCVHCGWKAEEAPETNERKCVVCGHPLKEGAVFCNTCGARNGAPVTEERAVKEKRKVNVAAIILSVALAISLMGGGFATYLYLSEDDEVVVESDNEKDEEKDKEEESEEKPEETPEEETPEEAKEYAPEEEVSEEEAIEEEVPEEETAETDDTSDDYIFPSDRELIFSEDLKGLSQAQVGLIRNEIYARHGYIFTTEPYITYFNSKSWYEPNENFSENDFNLIEKTNKEFIVNYEKEKGWR